MQELTAKQLIRFQDLPSPLKAQLTTQLDKSVVERVAKLQVSVAEVQAFTFKNGDAAFLCTELAPPNPD